MKRSLNRRVQSFFRHVWDYFTERPVEKEYNNLSIEQRVRSPKKDIDPLITKALYKKHKAATHNPPEELEVPEKVPLRKDMLSGNRKITTNEIKANSPLKVITPESSLGVLVKAYRRHNRWDVTTFLKRLEIPNLPRNFVTSVENWGLIPDPKIVERMAYVLGASRKDFINAAYKSLIEKYRAE